MNTCSRSGYLVGSLGIVPDDPSDFSVESLPIVGCNRIVCRHCKQMVQHEVDPAERLGFARWYRCECERWTERGERALDRAPVPWECAGHPALELPCRVDGVALDGDANLRDVAGRALGGWCPEAARSADRDYTYWLRRLHARLLSAPGRVVAGVALDRVTDVAPTVAEHAFEFFESVSDECVLNLLWRRLEALEPLPERARELARKLACSPERGGSALFTLLAKRDRAWLEANVEPIGRANPDRVQALYACLAALPDGTAQR